MKFPLLLSLDILRSRISRVFAGARDSSMILHLSPAAFSASNQKEIDAESDPNAATMQIPGNAISKTAAPVLWVGGDEPLQHPIIGRICAALNQAGRNVFLHTNGLRLRQRIHEFRPDPRLFLTLELAGREDVHDLSIGQPGAFRRAIEGIRAAKLSGFHVSAHVTVSSATDVCETGELFELLDNYGVDGYIVSSGGKAVETASHAALEEQLDEIRSLIRCTRWEHFSALLEDSYALRVQSKVAVPLAGNASGIFEESA